MIDKLLQRLSRRGPTGETLSPHTSLPAQGRPSLSSLPEAAGRSLMPLAGRSTPLPSSPAQPPGAWQCAVQAHQSSSTTPVHPPYFKDWSAAHIAVALRLWQEREHLHMGLIELFNTAGDWVASLHPPSRRVLIAASAYPNLGTAPQLLLRQHPADKAGAAAPSATQLAATHLHALLWHLGQSHRPAAGLLPLEMDTHRIELRRFPLIEPAALDVRHIALLHLFSAGAQTFEQLQSRLSAEQSQYICADLSSLYFTGTLKLLPVDGCSAAEKTV